MSFYIFKKLIDDTYMAIDSTDSKVKYFKSFSDMNAVFSKHPLPNHLQPKRIVTTKTLNIVDGKYTVNEDKAIKSDVEYKSEIEKALTEYLIEFNIQAAELEKELKMKNTFRKYFSPQIATLKIFEFIASKEFKDYKLIENEVFKNVYYNDDCKINIDEYEFMEDCYNGGLIYCDEQFEPIESHSYDLNFAYPRVLGDSDLMIPFKQGTKTKIDNVPTIKNLKFGFYRIKISSTDKNAMKLFSFNNLNCYNYYEVCFALKYAKKYKFKLEMITNGQYNAYIYENEDMIKSSQLFGRWYNEILSLRKKLPTNKLVKHIGSALWGAISQKNSVNVKEDDYDKNKYKDMKLVNISGDKDTFYYTLVGSNQPYKTNIRLKGWLHSYIRCELAKCADIDIENVIRIHTDSVTFKVKHDELISDKMKKEEKSSGNILWSNVNKYYKIDNNNKLLE